MLSNIAVGVDDVITSNIFFGDRSSGVDSVCGGVKNCPLPVTKPVAVNTVLALDRAACDDFQCVGVRQTAGGACEVTGGTENGKWLLLLLYYYYYYYYAAFNAPCVGHRDDESQARIIITIIIIIIIIIIFFV